MSAKGNTKMIPSELARAKEIISLASVRAAKEVCETFEVTAHRGISYKNSNVQTVQIIIEQQFMKSIGLDES